MVEPGDTQRREAPPPPPRRTTFVRSFTVELTTSLIVSALVASSPLLLVLSRNVGVALVAWVGFALVLLAVGVTVLYRHPEILRRLLHLLPGDLARWSWTVLVWAAAGAAAAGLVLGAVAAVRGSLSSGRGCASPLEIRAMTTPEALTPLRAAAAAFTAGTRADGCTAYSVTVTAEPGATPVRNGFARDWRLDQTGAGAQLLGPQPDVWVASSQAEYAYAADRADLGAAGPPPTLATRPPPVGGSPMVLALFGEDDGVVYREASRPGRETTAELLERFKAAGLKAVARPIPESSAAALAVTPVLHTAVTNTGLADSGKAAERFVSPPDLLAPDAVALLCEFRERASSGQAGPPRGYAVAVPEHVLNDYNAGRALGDRCDAVDAARPPYDRWKLRPYYARDLPALDYRFVQVRWPGQDDRERAGAVARFRGWLADRPLTSQGLRDAGGGLRPAPPDGTVPAVMKGPAVPGVQDSLDKISSVRDKALVSVLVDTSGSMGSPTTTRVNRSRLTHAVSVLRSMVAQLKGDDVLGLQSFAKVTAGGQTAVTTHVRGGLVASHRGGLVNDRLLGLVAARPDLPLADAITAADLRFGVRNIVVVTDGQSARTNPGLDRALDRLEDFRERHRDVTVTFLLTGPSRCDGTPVEQARAAVGGRCVELNGDPDEAQAARLLSEMR
ncbi:VWA domain-containing protein [Spirillospora sp. NPDC047279]|uniref:VWA domain-containing protein n=1 Tax=Spirillospora sp. NPDC047279 TaxID=3155478 RepID=UPI0033FA772D